MQSIAYTASCGRRTLRLGHPTVLPSGPSGAPADSGLLRRGEACVCHLQAALRVPQPYVSQQLRVLREAGLISQRREGLYIYYRLADPQVEWLLAEVLGPMEEISPFPECTCPRCQKTSLAEPIFLVEVN